MRKTIFLFFLAATGLLQAQPAVLLTEALTAVPGRQAKIARELKEFPLEAFNSQTAGQLSQLLSTGLVGGKKDYILLAGFLGESGLVEGLAAQSPSSKLKQAINLARVRTGNAAKRANLLKNIANYPVDDEFVYTVVPMLVYTRQREVIDFLWEEVITENLACGPADAETEGRIDCAARIVEYLAPIIEDFPVDHDEEGNLLTSDYAKAIAEIRRWYAVHSEDYRIITNTF
jgi:hypothetical protein